jgi:hypothetical protein
MTGSSISSLYFYAKSAKTKNAEHPKKVLCVLGVFTFAAFA